MINRISRRALACALLCTTAPASPALTQTIPDSNIPPPSRFRLDDNGVDLATGLFTGFATDVSVGASGDDGLAYVRQYGRGVSSSNWNYAVFVTGSAISVSVGLASYDFTFSGSSYLPADGKGASLAKSGSTYTLTQEDGTVVTFAYATRDWTDGSRVARGTTILRPSGISFTLTWVSTKYCTNNNDGCSGGQIVTGVRLQSVSSSLGHQLHFTYNLDNFGGPALEFADIGSWRKVDTITGINTTVDACDPAAGTCTLAHSWPRASYGSFGDVTDAVGNTAYYVSSGLTFKIRRASSAVDNITYSYDANNRVASVLRDGMSWSYAFTPGTGTMTAKRTDPLGHVRTVVSDTSVNLPTSVEDELGRTISYAYDPSGRLTGATLPEGNGVTLTYDSRGNATQLTRLAKPGSGLASITSSAAFPASCANPVTCNSPTSTTDAKGDVTDYGYDSTTGSLLSITRPAPAIGGVRPQTRYAYANVATPGGSVQKLQSISQCQTLASCAGSPDEAKTVFAWSSQLLPTSITRANGAGTLSATTAFGHDSIGNLTSIDGPLAGSADTTTLIHDADRRRIGVISPDPDGAGAMKMRAVRTSYTPDGNIAKVERGTVAGTSASDLAAMSVLETRTIGYDGAARPVTDSRAGADGVTQALTQASYDGEGRLSCSAVRMNGVTAADACTQTSGTNDRIGQAIYDVAGEVTQVLEGVGTGDVATTGALTYSDNGLVTSLTDAENNETTYVYDGFDRLAQVQYPSASKGAGTSNPDDDELFAYDADGNITGHTLRDNSAINFSYDNLDRLMLKDLPGSEPDVSYAYDNFGRLTSASESGNTLTFRYDALSRKTSEAGPLGTTTFAYDLADRRTGITYSTTGGGSALTVSYAYLTTGELDTINQGSTVLADYAYDNLGNRTGVAFGNGANQTFAYDAVSRLSQLKNVLTDTNDLTATFAWNPANQITSTTRTGDMYAWTGHGNGSTAYVSNGLNQLTSIGGAAASWDARGNLIGEPQSGRTYGYSSENRLTSASGGVTLGYDATMRLYQVAGASTTRFAYDGLHPIAEYDASNQLQRRFVFDPTTDQPVVWYEGAEVAASNRRYLSTDERGSVISVSDSTGASLGINSYDEYGKPGSTNIGRFQYTGQMWLPETGTYAFPFRDYVPQLGLFAQTDPIGQADNPNLYAYVHDDPVNLTDPLGLDCNGENTSQECPPIVINGQWPETTAPLQNGFYEQTLLGWYTASNAPVEVICDRACQERIRQRNKSAVNFGNDFGKNIFLCGGFSAGISAGGCATAGDVYIYAGITTPGPEVQLGYAPGGADAYVSGLTGSVNGMPGFGLASANGVPSSYAWTVGTPFGGFTYSVPVSRIFSRVTSFVNTLSNGFYEMLGRPYGP